MKNKFILAQAILMLGIALYQIPNAFAQESVLRRPAVHNLSTDQKKML